jgi:protein-disulfide isomerase
MDGAARHLAELVECAREQGRFAVAHNAAFDHARTSRDQPSISGFARSIGISNASSYASCMTEHRGRTAVDNQATVAHALAVRGTPIVVVGTSVYRGIPIKLDRILAAAFPSRRDR